MRLLDAVFPYEIHVAPDGSKRIGDAWRYLDVRQARLLARWLIAQNAWERRFPVCFDGVRTAITALREIAEQAVRRWRCMHVHHAPRAARSGCDETAYWVVRNSMNAKVFEFA